MDQKLIQLKEYVRIVKDAPYALKTYLTTYDNTQKKYVPLDLFPDQIQLIKDYETYNENITKKYRQAGVTTVTAAWISRRLQIAKPENPERVLIIANKRDTAIEMANKIRHFIDQWPEWINVGFSVDKNSESRFRLNNGCEVKAVATSADALRGYTPTILIFDEAAYIEAGEDFWAASMASLSCVHEESYIFTDNGILQLKDIISEKKNIGFTKYNGDIKVINKDKKIVNIKNTFKSEKSTCYNIKTKLGYELIGSFKHPLLVNTTTDNDEWVWMENMKVGDKIKFQFDQNLFGKDQDIKFDLKHFNEKEKYNLPLKLSDDLDLCYLMGLFISEGNYNDNTIAITNGDDEIINFLLNMGFVKSRKHHFYYTSSYLKRFFQEYIGISKSKAKDKKIPSIILRSSKNVVKTFLQGMFDGDGCAFKNGVKYTSTSKELISQLQILLLNFGVQSYVKYTEEKTSQTSILTNKNHITKIYNLFIKNQYIERFFNEIGFRLTRKQIKQDSYKNKIKNSQTIYATKDELKTILKENGIKRSQYEKEFRFMDGLLRRNKTKISLHSVERLFEKNLPNKTTLSIWENRYENLKSYFYDEIINIDSFEDDTYDLEIPDGHSFVSNGIISHNTGGKIILISCVTKDTYVFTNNGLEQVSNFIHTESPVGVGYFTEDYEIRGKDNVRKSNILLNNGKQKTKKITTLHSSIEGTHTHKVWSFSKTKNEYGWNCFSELSVGDYINVGFNFNMWGNNDKINYVYESSSKENNIFFTSEITNEIAYFLGLFLAEGSIYQKFNDSGNLIGSNITITCGDDISELLLKLNLKYYQKDGLHYNISSKSLSNFLKELGFDFNLKAKNKIIPKKLLSLSKEKTKFLLQGLFDGDGFSDKNRLRIGIGLSSKEMINQIRMLLLNFGILTDYYEVNTKPTKKVKVYSMNYRITAVGKNADTFYDEIGFGFERKNKKRIKYNPRIDSFDIIPNGSKILLDIIDKNKIQRKNITKDNLRVWDQLKKVENLSRKSFEELFSEISKLTNSIDENYIYDKILISNSKWDKIKSIEDSENETFDFSLYESPNDFWCHSIYYNGYLGHQTPNGFDPIYHGVYDQSIRGMNDFHITDLRWFKDPRYSKDLRWVKCIDICHYMLNREEYNDDEIILYDFEPEKYNEYLEMGYKPFSSWFESMSKKFKYDRRKISQEIECVDGSTIVTVKNKKTNEIINMTIEELYNSL
jgi:intein/homing endonuclease